MSSTFTRRAAISGTSLSLVALAGCANATMATDSDALRALERRSGGRLGVSVLETSTGRSIGYREHERFGMCSTFKMPLAALVLREADAGRINPNQILTYTEADIVSNSPATKAAIGRGGMTVTELAEAAQVVGDNTAANLLLRELGGPSGFTAMLRSLNDDVTRLDRTEPDVNLVVPGDLRDTTTPAAMARLMAKLLTGDVLSRASRERVIAWMVATRTGMARIRAGLPSDWRVGDKTGSGIAESMVNKYNDIAITWPPSGDAVIISAYYDGPGHFDELRDEDQAVLAEVGRIASAWATQ